jgi:hypothetical protein
MLRFTMRLTMLFGLMLAGFLPSLAPTAGAAPSMTTQDYGGMVIGVMIECDDAADCGAEHTVRVSVTTQDGSFVGACTMQWDLMTQQMSHVPGCGVDFPFPPTGTLIVTQDVSTLPAGYAPEQNPISIDTTHLGMASHDVVFHNVPHGASASAVTTSDVAIVTTENGQPAYDACYVLVGYSEVGCDENRDGKVTFAEIPWGTYTVRQTADLGPGRYVDDFTIEVRGNVNSAGFEAFGATIVTATGGVVTQPQPGGAIDISLITRDPQTGGLLTGTCYVLVGYGNEGCDENGDGQVTFDAIPFGTWTVHQTRVPAGYPAVTDFQIDVPPTEYPTGFVVRQASQPNAPDTRNVSVMLIDVATNTKVPMDACVQIVNASNVGCDDDLRDGQIDFLDVVAGNHDIVVTRLPAGYTVANPDELFIQIDPRTDPANRFVYLYVQRGGV